MPFCIKFKNGLLYTLQSPTEAHTKAYLNPCASSVSLSSTKTPPQNWSGSIFLTSPSNVVVPASQTSSFPSMIQLWAFDIPLNSECPIAFKSLVKLTKSLIL